jgi:hypothetical protein
MTLLILLAILIRCTFDSAMRSYHYQDQDQDQDRATIGSFIARQARRERGEEYDEARKVMAGDLNGDGIPETVVLYTIESQGGSNNYIQYLVVFGRRDRHLVAITHTPVGGKSRRSVELGSVTHQRVNLEDPVLRTEGCVMLSKHEGHNIVRAPRPDATRAQADAKKRAAQLTTYRGNPTSHSTGARNT